MPPELPAVLDDLDEAVMTGTRVTTAGEVDRARLDACGLASAPDDTVVIERVGIRGSTLTFNSRPLFGCDAIRDPATAVDPDRPYAGVWCSAPNGRFDDGGLNDPRLSLCPSTQGDLTAFVWVEPQAGTKWVVVADAGTREVYVVVGSLPVRVTTTDGVEPESSRASFDIEEYAADGTKLREYTLEAAVAG
jgi:hypothetical protein